MTPDPADKKNPARESGHFVVPELKFIEVDPIDNISRRIGVDEQTAEVLAGCMADLYENLAALGKVDCYGGAESRRVIPEAIEFVVRSAGLSPAGLDLPPVAQMVMQDGIWTFGTPAYASAAGIAGRAAYQSAAMRDRVPKTHTWRPARPWVPCLSLKGRRRARPLRGRHDHVRAHHH